MWLFILTLGGTRLLEAQASDRAHRIGQDKQVTIYKLITSGTVEENVLQLQQEKENCSNKYLKNPKRPTYFLE